MKFNARIVSAILAMIMALSLFTSCGEPAKSDVKTDDESEVEVIKEPKNPITVTAASSSKASYKDSKLYALEELTTYSPDGNIKAMFWQDENKGVYYSVSSGKEEVIIPSKLGMLLSTCDFSTGIEEITSYDRPDEINDKYDTALTISLSDVNCVDHCMEREITLKKGDASLKLMVRVYDDGFAYRYQDVTTGKDGKVFVTSELSEINLPKDTVTFAGGYSATYEFDYIERKYSELESHNGVFNTPLTAYTGKRWMLFSESDVYANDISYGKSLLETKSGSASLLWRFGFDRDPAQEVTDELASPGHLRITEVRTINGFTTPWRVAIIADDVNELLGSDVIDSLCPAMDEELFKDTSWIKPGKVSWSWWSGCDQRNYDIQVDHVDFSSKYGWEYCCLDAGWPAFEDRIEEICKYAKKKNVGIILWVNYFNLKTPEEIEKLFSQWSKWGVVGVKTDYFESDDIDVMEVMRNVAEIGAKYKLMVYYHGCINPCGETRTYPNIMTSEAVLGEEFRKWSTSPSPRNCLMYPFTRNVTGSMDYTPSCIAIGKTGETAGFSLAKTIVYESALQHFASAAYSFPSYLGIPVLSKMPTAWDKSTVLEGYPGDYITYLRQSGDDYYIGSMTLKKRTADVKLDFLGDGEYKAYVYYDKDGELALREEKVTSKSTLKLEMPEIGGAAVLITKDKFDTKVEDSATNDLEGYKYYECEDGKLSGAANIADATMCSGGKKVGYVGNGNQNSLDITVNVDKDGKYELLVYFCTGESRGLDIYVDGNRYEMKYLTSPGFDIPSSKSITVELKKGKNKIMFTSLDGFAPDLDRIAISDKTK